MLKFSFLYVDLRKNYKGHLWIGWGKKIYSGETQEFQIARPIDIHFASPLYFILKIGKNIILGIKFYLSLCFIHLFFIMAFIIAR